MFKKCLRLTGIQVNIGTGAWNMDGITLDAAAGSLNLASGVLSAENTVKMNSDTISIAASIGKPWCRLLF